MQAADIAQMRSSGCIGGAKLLRSTGSTDEASSFDATHRVNVRVPPRKIKLEPSIGGQTTIRVSIVDQRRSTFGGSSARSASNCEKNAIASGLRSTALTTYVPHAAPPTA